MNDEKIAQMIDCLNHLAQRPANYVGYCDPERVQVFLCGVLTALNIVCDLREGVDRGVIARSRGWKYLPTGLIREMRELGKSDAEIIAEQIAIEIEVIKQL